MRFALSAGGLGVVAAAVAFLWLRATPAPEAAGGGAPEPSGTDLATPAMAGQHGAGEAEPPADEAALIAQLQERFGDRLHEPRAQIRALEKLMRYLQERYPGNWRERLRALLERAFPGLAAEMFARFEKLESHIRWLEDNQRSLGAMSAAQRREVLWAARYQAFGAEAEQIWAGERRAEQLGDSLAALDAGGGSVTEKLERYTAAIASVYGEEAPRMLVQRGPELLGRFLAVESVQQQLRALPAEERRTALRSVRAGLGLDEAALQRWDQLDASRDAAWSLGERYMAERAAILAVGAPESQAQQLDELRRRVFGAEEAAVLAGEEAAGFFRYGQPRRIGRE